MQLLVVSVLCYAVLALHNAEAMPALSLPDGAFVGRLTMDQTMLLGGSAAGPKSKARRSPGSTASVSTISFAGTFSTPPHSPAADNGTAPETSQARALLLSLDAITNCTGSAQVLTHSRTASTAAPSDLTCTLLTSACFTRVLSQLSLRFSVDTSDGSLGAMQPVPRSPSHPTLVYLQAALAIDTSLLAGVCRGVWPAPSATQPGATWDGVAATLEQASSLLQALASQLEIRYVAWLTAVHGGHVM